MAASLLCVLAFFTVVKPRLAFLSLFYVKHPFASASQTTQASSSTPSAAGASPAIVHLGEGETIGSISIPGAGMPETPLLAGQTNAELLRGIGLYTGAQYPGEGGKVVLAGHSELAFSHLRSARIGELVNIKTNYGSYTYSITDTKVVPETDVSIQQRDASREYLVMYTYYPFDAIGYRSSRFVVYANYVSGPQAAKQP